MAGRLEGVGIATLLVLLGLVALPNATAKHGGSLENAITSGETDTCDPKLAGADYVGGVDVSGNHVVPANIGGGFAVDLSHVSAAPILVPGRHGRHVEVVVQGAEPAEPAPPCKGRPH